MLRLRPLGIAVSLGLAAPLLATAPAPASPPVFQRISEPYSNHFVDFCGVSGLVVDQSGTFQSRLKILTKKSGLDYFLEHVTTDETLTGAVSGRSVRVRTSNIAKDLKVVDNGDGTLTIIQLLTGPSTVYGPDGKAIARDPGQLRVRVVVDTNGTPSDPDDDFELSAEIIKGSTGRSDDYCAAIVAAIG